MQSKAKSLKDSPDEVPAERMEAFNNLREVILSTLPKGFKEIDRQGLINYVVPLSTYPAGYHCNPSLPLGFASISLQKNSISFHHMGLYGNTDLFTWFVKEYAKYSKYKLDMGKSCVRFKKPDQIPFQLIGELMQKFSVKEWISLYEKNLSQSKKK